MGRTNGQKTITMPLDNYMPAHKEQSLELGGTNYFQFVTGEGYWYIQRETDTDTDYVAGLTDFETNWTNRASLSYASFDQVFPTL